jgi:tripartite-type tricarboxylate transporter receptor subunit TctC
MLQVHLLRLLTLLAGLVVPALLAAAHAAEVSKPAGYPERQITVIVCFGAGGGGDQMARAIAAPAEKILGVPVAVVNKPGAGGLSCLPDFLGAPADGYTILQHTDNANVVPSQIYVNATDQRFLTDGKPDFDKVVGYAKANPEQMTVSNYGTVENMEGVTLAMIQKFFGFKSKVVAFDKAAERYGAVVGKRIDVLLEQPSDVKALLDSGDLAPVLTIWPERFAAFPDTKALGADYGIDWQPIVRWRALFIRPDTPKAIVDYLEAAFKQAYETDEHQAYLKRKSMDILNSYRSSADTRALIEREVDAYLAVYRELGMPSR